MFGLVGFHIKWTLFRSSGHFSNHLDTFQVIWMLFKLSRDFLYPLTFFRSYGHFAYNLDTFQIIRTLFISSHIDPRSSGYFAGHMVTLDYQDIFQNIWTLCIPSTDFLYCQHFWRAAGDFLTLLDWPENEKVNECKNPFWPYLIFVTVATDMSV